MVVLRCIRNQPPWLREPAFGARGCYGKHRQNMRYTVSDVQGRRREREVGRLLLAAMALVALLRLADASEIGVDASIPRSTRGYTTTSLLQCPDGKMRRVSCANGGVPDEHTCMCRFFSPWSGPQCDWVGAGSSLISSGGDCVVYRDLPRAQRANSSTGLVFVDPNSGSGVYIQFVRRYTPVPNPSYVNRK